MSAWGADLPYYTCLTAPITNATQHLVNREFWSLTMSDDQHACGDMGAISLVSSKATGVGLMVTHESW